MSDEKKLSDRFMSYLYSMHPVMMSVSELFRYADEIATLEKRLAGAESWRGQIDAFVRRIMGEVNCGKACGGLDGDQNDPQSTTQVVLAGIKAHTQAAIDAALGDLIHDLGWLYMHRDGHDLYNSTIDDVARFIKGRLGTNPLAERAAEYARGIEFRVGQLAERDARIAELEAALVDARNSITSWISENEEKIAELEADNTKLTKKLEAGWVRVCQTGLVEAHDRIAELERQLGEMSVAIETGDRAISRNLELERELAEARRAGERI